MQAALSKGKSFFRTMLSEPEYAASIASPSVQAVLSLSREEVIRQAKIIPPDLEETFQQGTKRRDPMDRLCAKLLTGKVDPDTVLIPKKEEEWEEAHCLAVILSGMKKLKQRRKEIKYECIFDTAALDQKYQKMYNDAQGMIPMEYFNRIRVEEEKKSYVLKNKLIDFGRFQKVYEEALEQILYDNYIDAKIVAEEIVKIQARLDTATRIADRNEPYSLRTFLELNPEVRQKIQDEIDSGGYGDIEVLRKGAAFQGFDADSVRFPELYWSMPNYQEIEPILRGEDMIHFTPEQLVQVEAAEKAAAEKAAAKAAAREAKAAAKAAAAKRST